MNELYCLQNVISNGSMTIDAFFIYSLIRDVANVSDEAIIE